MMQSMFLHQKNLINHLKDCLANLNISLNVFDDRLKSISQQVRTQNLDKSSINSTYYGLIQEAVDVKAKRDIIQSWVDDCKSEIDEINKNWFNDEKDSLSRKEFEERYVNCNNE